MISNISSGNKALEFIDKRISYEDYRGNISSQHNRYTFFQVMEIMYLLNKYAPKQSLMRIRTTDISKRPENTPEEYTYAKFCDEAKEKAGIGTQDAMRKNLFVDFHRMGLIVRYDSKKTPIIPDDRGQVKFVSISRMGLRLVMAKNLIDKYFIFSKGVDSLLGGNIELLLNLLRDEKYELRYIGLDEYTFFISAIGTNTKYNLNVEQASELMKEYRRLTPIQKRAVLEKLKEELNPKRYKGTKKDKRDFHNWMNKTQQIFYILNQTVYFEVNNGKLSLKISTRDKKINEVRQAIRSVSQKEFYFEIHKIKKTRGFELHHVVPLSWSESLYHFKLLDKWENMVYIDGFSHAKITQNRNKNIILKSVIKDIILLDYSNNKVYLKYKENILYNPDKKRVLVDYNKELLNTLK